MFGRIFLILVVVGVIWGAWSLVGAISAIGDGSAGKKYLEDFEAVPDAPRPQTVAPVSFSGQKISADEPEDLEIVVLAESSDGWILVESWGIVPRGGRLPGGATLVDWRRDQLLVSVNGVDRVVDLMPVGWHLAHRAVTAGVATSPTAPEPR